MKKHTRFAIFASLMIYGFLLIVYLRRSMPLKYDESNLLEVEASGKIIESLLEEMEIPKSSLKDLQDVNRVENLNSKSLVGEDSKHLLEGIFGKADSDRNGALDIRELAKWIHAKIIDHIDRAMRENIGLFTAIDSNPRNGKSCFQVSDCLYL